MEKARFRDMLVQRLRAQANLIGAFTTHKTLTGSARERAIIHVLREMLPRCFEPLTGSIAAFDRGGQIQTTDRQIDLMIVDTWRYPTLFRDGDTAIVFAEAVRAIVEIKTKAVGRWAWFDTLLQSATLGNAVDARGTVPRVVFAYEADGADALADSLRILNWARGLRVDAEGWAEFTPLVRKGRSEKSTPGNPRRLLRGVLRPGLLPALVLGGSGVVARQRLAAETLAPQFELSGPGMVEHANRGGSLEAQFARLLEFLLGAAKDAAAAEPGDVVLQQLRRVIGGDEDLPPTVNIDMKEGTADVLDPTVNAAETEGEETDAS